MHVPHRGAHVEHLHAKPRHVLRNGTAAALLHLTELRHLPDDLLGIHDPADLGNELGRTVAGIALGGATRILRGRDALVEPRLVAGRVDVGKVRIRRSRDVGRQHRGLLERAADENVARVLFLPLDQLRDRVLKEGTLHAGRTDRADLLLVAHQD